MPTNESIVRVVKLNTQESNQNTTSSNVMAKYRVKINKFKSPYKSPYRSRADEIIDKYLPQTNVVFNKTTTPNLNLNPNPNPNTKVISNRSPPTISRYPPKLHNLQKTIETRTSKGIKLGGANSHQTTTIKPLSSNDNKGITKMETILEQKLEPKPEPEPKPIKTEIKPSGPIKTLTTRNNTIPKKRVSKSNKSNHKTKKITQYMIFDQKKPKTLKTTGKAKGKGKGKGKGRPTSKNSSKTKDQHQKDSFYKFKNRAVSNHIDISYNEAYFPTPESNITETILNKYIKNKDYYHPDYLLKIILLLTYNKEIRVKMC